jgi:hypothetical protein
LREEVGVYAEGSEEHAEIETGFIVANDVHNLGHPWCGPVGLKNFLKDFEAVKELLRIIRKSVI